MKRFALWRVIATPALRSSRRVGTLTLRRVSSGNSCSRIARASSTANAAATENVGVRNEPTETAMLGTPKIAPSMAPDTVPEYVRSRATFGPTLMPDRTTSGLAGSSSRIPSATQSAGVPFVAHHRAQRGRPAQMGRNLINHDLSGLPHREPAHPCPQRRKCDRCHLHVVRPAQAAPRRPADQVRTGHQVLPHRRRVNHIPAAQPPRAGDHGLTGLDGTLLHGLAFDLRTTHPFDGPGHPAAHP